MEQHMNAVKQAIEMQKAGFDNMLNSTLMFLNQSDLMLNSFLGFATWMPEEMKNAFRQQWEANKQAFAFFKKSVDDGFDNLKKLLEEGKLPKFGNQ
jgi:hypothetical protein